MPNPRRSFDGYRLLQEYFAMPERFHFVELSGLRPALAKSTGEDVDLYILLGEPLPDKGASVLDGDALPDGVEETFHHSTHAFRLQGQPHRLRLLRRMTRELSRAEVAMYAAKSRGRGNFQFFSAEMNRATHERLMLEARRLLAYTPMAVAQVAQQLGFDDPAYFSKCFARQVGSTPSAYRLAVVEGVRAAV